MKTISFELTMPNRGSWNGQWTGQDNKYYIIKKMSDKSVLNFIPEGYAEESYHYSWNDGWGANIRCQIIDSGEARKRRKLSKGFYGYDWMVDNIIWHGTPYSKKESVL